MYGLLGLLHVCCMILVLGRVFAGSLPAATDVRVCCSDGTVGGITLCSDWVSCDCGGGLAAGGLQQQPGLSHCR
jgi:hypothetical protein